MTTPAIDVTVQSDRGAYAVRIGPGLTRRLGALLRGIGVAAPPLVVSSAPVWRLQGGRLRGLKTSGPAVLIGDGERAKTLASVRRIYDAAAARRLDRAATIVAVGGGVVGDVAGFAAASYLRGVRLVQVPTTLLAQVDSAIGGKVGVNLPAGKNLVGAFHAPALVVCDPDVLDTLPPREFQAGMYEVVKYGVIASRALFDVVAAHAEQILERDRLHLTVVIAHCCRIKGDIVSRDERESGPRRALNFGHTIGHALEAITGYRRFRHGEAVAYGMLAAARLSVIRGRLSIDDEGRLIELVGRLGPLPPVGDLDASAAVAAVRLDKKVVGGRLHFVLADGLGSTSIAADVTPRELTAAIRAIGLSR
jgi:3-dehydroquinate synthase